MFWLWLTLTAVSTLIAYFLGKKQGGEILSEALHDGFSSAMWRILEKHEAAIQAQDREEILRLRKEIDAMYEVMYSINYCSSYSSFQGVFTGIPVGSDGFGQRFNEGMQRYFSQLRLEQLPAKEQMAQVSGDPPREHLLIHR